MDDNLKKERMLSNIPEFEDKMLEKEYVSQEMGKALVYIKPLIWAMGFLYFLFLIPDYFLIKCLEKYNFILATRVLFLFLIIVLSVRIKFLKNYYLLIYWITIYEIIAFLLFFSTYILYESPDFLIQTYGLMLILMVIFIVPNRWIYMIVVSLPISAVFFIYSFMHFSDLKMAHFSAAVIYTSIVIILSSIASFRTNSLKRIQYLSTKRLEEMVITDPLTGIYNRAKFNEELDNWVNYSKRYQGDLTLVIFDIDNFKSINDDYGHLIGDGVIVDTVELVKQLIRETDVFSRWGGEEFVILLPNMNIVDAEKLVERLRVAIERHVYNKKIEVTCSFGVVALKPDEDGKSLFHRADLLLYEAKEDGKNIIKSQL